MEVRSSRRERRRPARRAGRTVFVVSMLVAAVVPANAAADGRLEIVSSLDSGYEARYTGDDGVNDLRVRIADDRRWLVVHDRVGAVAAGAGCVAVDAATARCDLRAKEYPPHIRVQTSAGDDAVVLESRMVIHHAGGGDTYSLTVEGMAGNDHLDVRPVVITGKAYRPSVLGGDGDDVLSGTGLQGGPGDDQLTGDADDDFLRGGHGVDRLTGGAGNDRLVADRTDAVADGGTGDDHITVLPGAPGTPDVDCGAGADTAYAPPVPVDTTDQGPVVPETCERFYRFKSHPVAVGERSLRFRVGCLGGPFFSRFTCRARLLMRWQGKVVAQRTFSATDRRLLRVTLPVPRELWHAIRRGPETVGLEVRRFREISEDIDETIGAEYFYNYRWQIALAR